MKTERIEPPEQPRWTEEDLRDEMGPSPPPQVWDPFGTRITKENEDRYTGPQQAPHPYVPDPELPIFDDPANQQNWDVNRAIPIPEVPRQEVQQEPAPRDTQEEPGPHETQQEQPPVVTYEPPPIETPQEQPTEITAEQGNPFGAVPANIEQGHGQFGPTSSGGFAPHGFPGTETLPSEDPNATRDTLTPEDRSLTQETRDDRSEQDKTDAEVAAELQGPQGPSMAELQAAGYFTTQQPDLQSIDINAARDAAEAQARQDQLESLGPAPAVDQTSGSRGGIAAAAMEAAQNAADRAGEQQANAPYGPNYGPDGRPIDFMPSMQPVQDPEAPYGPAYFDATFGAFGPNAPSNPMPSMQETTGSRGSIAAAAMEAAQSAANTVGPAPAVDPLTNAFVGPTLAQAGKEDAGKGEQQDTRGKDTWDPSKTLEALGYPFAPIEDPEQAVAQDKQQEEPDKEGLGPQGAPQAPLRPRARRFLQQPLRSVRARGRSRPRWRTAIDARLRPRRPRRAGPKRTHGHGCRPHGWPC